MSDRTSNPQAGIANAVSDLGEQTAVLVRQEIQAAKEEMLRKARQGVPGAVLVGLATVSGLLALTSSYRLWNRVSDRVLGPVLGPIGSMAGFAVLAAYLYSQGWSQLRQVPAPLPSETVVQTGTALDATIRQTGR